MRYFLLLPFLLCSIAPAQSPTTQPTKTAAEIDIEFRAASSIARRECEEKIAVANDERIRELKASLADAMARQDIEGAVKLRDAIKSAGQDGVPPRLQLQNSLANRHWTWGNELLRFDDDGTVFNPSWANQKVTTRWVMIDARTVLLVIAKGRKTDRLAVLTFNPQMDTYTGYGFQGDPIEPNHAAGN